MALYSSGGKLVTSGGGAFFSGGILTPPNTYSATTDTNVYAEPTPPTWGAAGSIITDSIFNNRILRVTDSSSAGVNKSWAPTSGSVSDNRWNADGTRFTIINSDGGSYMVLDFNASTFQATPRMVNGAYLLSIGIGVSGSSDLFWDTSNPDLLIGLDSSNNVKSYDIITTTLTLIWDTSSLGGGAGGWMLNDICRANGRLIVRAGAQDSATLVASFDSGSSTTHKLDCNAGTLDGVSIPLYVNGVSQPWTAVTIHGVFAGQEGRYCMITPTGGVVGTYTNPSRLLWDIDGGIVSLLEVDLGGHSTLAYGQLINNDYLGGAHPYTPYQMLNRDITTSGGMSAPSMLNNAGSTYDGSPGDVDTYCAWVNAQPGRQVPVMWSTFANPSTPNPDDPTITVKWQREILAIATDGSQTVYRFCHHYSYGNGGYYYDGALASISPNGLYIMFSSNWANSLGTGSGHPYREDVFIVELKAA